MDTNKDTHSEETLSAEEHIYISKSLHVSGDSMIRVEDLFIKSGRKKAISFEEFFAAGWDEITYMNYLTKCEVVRSGFTFFRGTGEWIEFFKSFEYHRKNSALHRIKRDSPISCIQEDIVFENTIRYEPIPLDEAKKKIQL